MNTNYSETSILGWDLAWDFMKFIFIFILFASILHFCQSNLCENAKIAMKLSLFETFLLVN